MSLSVKEAAQAHDASRPNLGQLVFVRPEGGFLNSPSP